MADDLSHSTSLGSLVDSLQRLNRKERYWLLRNALGQTGADLPLSRSFLERLGEEIGKCVSPSAWWAMDYHIDWLFSALVLDFFGGVCPDRFHNPRAVDSETVSSGRLIRGTNEDFDLIVAFDRTIILIEAKGVTSWGNKQIARKCQRLREWSELSDQIVPGFKTSSPVEIFVVLMSPKPPSRLDRVDWPTFVKTKDGEPFRLRLDLADAPEVFLAPERCDESGLPASMGDCWQLKPLGRPNLDEN
ncbi:hypothetical protein RHECIAT_CH0000862 [Rhizobium etli CIAT 652]|uniref:Uncharacterized protein n=1 Tax=Rhizobium etli (strain CIAT 652) TaxID=491916 RepID=B3PQK2_RHIE6|nr:hypothetical protein RHECIAT_CH0000862 [Rhizobium etli CIAT 652]